MGIPQNFGQSTGSGSPNPPTVVQLVHIDETGDSYYRMRWPARDLAAQDPSIRIINLQHNAAERFALLEQADLAVIYQSHDVDLLPIIERRKAAGKKTLVEYNDNFYAPATPSPVQEGWSSPLLWNVYEAMIRAADAVLVTGPGLLELFTEKFPDKRIEVLENHLPFQPQPFQTLWDRRSQAIAAGKIVIGWAGSVGHMADLIAVAPLLRKIATERPNVTIAMMGNESIPGVMGLPQGRLQFVQWGTMQQYFNFLSNLHIGIAPALDTPYNRCRSDIKAVELASQGVVPLLQEVLPYRDFIRDSGCDSFSDIAGLEKLLSDLIYHPDRIRDRAAKAHEHVSKSRVGVQHRRRLELYREFFPANVGSISSPIPPGCHEINGSPETEYRNVKALAAVQKMVKDKQMAPAAAAARQALAQNPYSAEMTLQYLRIVRTQNQPGALLPLIDQAISRFPNDLRFELLKARSVSTAEEQISVWNAIAEHVRTNVTSRRFFQRDIVGNIVRTLPQNFGLLRIAQMFIELYPAVYSLRLEVGTLLERTGKDQEALEQFRKALEIIETIGANVETSATERKYALTWCEALEARLKGK
jgi:tetratricopeptide (TPR) repeat protein